MIQEIIALAIVLYFIFKQTLLYRRQLLPKGEYLFWLTFWLLVGLSILSLPLIDRLLASLGFSASGIGFLTEMAVAVLFYFIFRLRLRVTKLERDIACLTEALALKN